MDPLRVDADLAFDIAHVIGNDAEELRDELTILQRDWANLASGWDGVASSAYATIWAEWWEGATMLVDALAEATHKLGVAAVRYSDHDAGAAAALDAAAIDLGL